ncbi:tripartite tricarboxylate transporter TctB family protein [Vibrio sp. HA2012]|uniref:tripartite tricarboxylate transporter TctB family protein n=1 Tax=Vibrio sp. HA2012 TaxID=1971595 RepID=UPI000C2B937B|nr:tripartite tricarboxylate transporter TctB family protein [Vibrio sp. HA2012]PJC87311.1 tripartite tricarboxylate transporter TctB family protein [Vibrio sp. HA2012]
MENKNVRPNWDAFTGLFGVAFGLIYGYMTYTMPRAAFGNPMDPLYFPLGVSAVSVLIGILVLVKSDFKAAVLAYKNLINEDESRKNDRRRILYTCIIAVGYALVFEHLGYIISTFMFMFCMLTITSGKKSWMKSIIIALLFSVGVYFVFNTLLSISLPPLPFGE